MPRRIPTEHVSFLLFEDEKTRVTDVLVAVADKEGFRGDKWREQALLHLCETYAEEYGGDY